MLDSETDDQTWTMILRVEVTPLTFPRARIMNDGSAFVSIVTRDGARCLDFIGEPRRLRELLTASLDMLSAAEHEARERSLSRG